MRWKKAAHNLSARAIYGVSFLGQNGDVYSASVAEVMYEISCYIGLRNNNKF